MNYKFQKSEKDKVTNQDLKALLLFLKEKSKINEDLNNLNVMKTVWKALNPK